MKEFGTKTDQMSETSKIMKEEQERVKKFVSSMVVKQRSGKRIKLC
jgi:hypothetical protein